MPAPKGYVKKTYLCKWCGKEFYRSPAELRGGFCSRECFAEVRLKKENYTCPECGAKKAWNAERCRKCWAKSNLRGQNYPCRNCGRDVYKSPADWKQVKRSLGVFCNRTCFANYTVGERHPSHIHGKSRATYTRQFHKNKKIARERDGSACLLCWSTELLDGHHIDWNTRNNEIWNLATLCRGCHNKQRGTKQQTVDASNRLYALLTYRFGYQERFST